METEALDLLKSNNPGGDWHPGWEMNPMYGASWEMHHFLRHGEG